MGHDEHGPAYPEPPCKQAYRCPICKGDENRFMTCDYPGCPDGCDQPGRFRTYPATPSEPGRWTHILVSATVALIVSLAISMCHMARG